MSKKIEKTAQEPEKKVEQGEARKPVEKPVEEALKKPRKPKETKPMAVAAEKQKKERKISSYYKTFEEGLERLRPFCERCGPGYFMADHGDRYACGHCGFTRYKQREEKEQ